MLTRKYMKEQGLTTRSVNTLALYKPHILKSKGGAWHVAAMSTVPRELVKAAVEYRNNFLEKNTFQR